jgi:hypothetical protein
MRWESITFVSKEYPQQRYLTEQFPARRSSGLHIEISTLRLRGGSTDYSVEHVGIGTPRSVMGAARD